MSERLETFQTDYRHLLRDELVKRCAKNPVYSARAMARDLGLSAAFFSQIISGTRALSEARATDLAERFDWTGKKRKIFVLAVRLSLAKGLHKNEVAAELQRLTAHQRVPLRSRFRNLSHDEFALVAEWFHFAIVELAQISPLADSSRDVARRLGISSVVAMQAIERLLHLGLIERRGTFLHKSQTDYRIGAVPSEAIRQFHRQHLKKAAAALEGQDFAARDFSGTTMAIDAKKLPRAKALIRRFQNELSEFLECGDRSAVYHLAIQMYRLDYEAEKP